MARRIKQFFSILLVACMLLSMMPAAVFAATPSVVYLMPNSEWLSDGARFAAYFFNDSGNTWVSMTDSDGDGYYEASVPSGYSSVIFCRMNSSSTENNWDNKWNQTSDLTLPTDGSNCWTLNSGDWAGGGAWSAYAVVDYYLFGYINGANYACEEDGSNIGTYKFTDGKLTATFDCDSYVAVKTGDNASWYMTNGYDASATTVTLYNTNSGIAVPEKMFVPGGVAVTFTLTVNSDDTLILSYTTDTSTCAHSAHDTDGNCTVCGKLVGHSWSDGTCSGCGTSCSHSWSSGKCLVCGVSCSHSYDSGTVTKAATCTASGTKTYTCTTCGTTKTETIAATGHSYTSKVTAPTCTATGYTTYTCSSCGDSYTDSTTAATGHSYDSGTVTKAATCTTSGTKTYTCTACGTTKTETIAATGHSYTSKVTAPTCTASGYTTYTCSGCGDSYTGNTTAATDHSYVNGACTNCGDGCSHSYDSGTVTKAATCTASGTKTYTCTICGTTKTETIAATGHSYTSKVTAPTCTTSGYTTYTCSSCGDSYTGNTTAATGHSYNSGTVTTAATCTTAGVKTYTCTSCGTTKTESIAATGHSYTSKVTAPTCTDSGYTTYTCSSCGDSYTDNTTAATGHSWSNGACTSCDTACSHSFSGATCTICSLTRDYYLFGYINGANYACEEDGSNIGTYKFTNGKLTATFDCDSYVAVKTGDNASWYMTNGYDSSATTVTLYNTNSGIAVPEKMFVPGGIAVTFTLTINSDDTLTLSYTLDASTCLHMTHSTAGICFTCGSTVDHSFSGASCTVCGLARDYYLFGYINGANYACEEDGDNIGTYKFTNGQLMVTFDSDSYVGVKTGDNVDWYMTNGYDASATTVTLYNTASGIAVPEKMFVPGGTEITFTLVVNTDDTLTLSYEVDVCHHLTHDTNGLCTACGTAVDHSWDTGVCTVCGTACGHSWSSGDCTICGLPCMHESHSTTGKCDVCGSTVGHTFENGACTVCGRACTHSWSDGVCTVCGAVCEHSWQDSVCTTCSKSCTHNWNGADCTICGGIRDYYLFGFINGADYAYGDDSQNLGIYKFVDGQITVTFTEDAYVGIKTSDNMTWYMTEGYQGTASSVTMLNTASGLAVPEKMYIPGGVEVTITMVINADSDTLTVSYAVNSSTCQHLSHSTDGICSSCGSTVSHSWGDGVQTGAPTCTESGEMSYTCSICGGTKTESVAATGHSYTGVVTAPTCTSSGYTTYTCSTCGNSYTGDTTAATGHSYDAVVTAPTCTAGGYTTYTCSTCGDSYTGNTTAATGHSYVNGVCSGCGDGCSHSYDSGTVTAAATCTTAGVKTYTCSLCGGTKTESIAATGHNYNGVVTAPTCTAGGYTTYTCSTCGDSYTGDTTAATGHSYTGVVTAPTCTSGGYTTYTCSTCGDSYTGDTTAATGHSYSGGACTVCGGADPSYSVDYYLFGYINGGNYACEEDGSNLGIYKFMDGKLTVTFDVDSYVAVKTGDNANWYMTEGYDASLTTVILYNTNSGIAVPDKMFVPGGVEVTFTLVVNGDDTLTLSYVTNVCAHSYTSSVTTAPTCTTAGVRTYTCSLCGSSYTEEVAALGHSYDSGTVTTAATCTAAGVKTYTCSTCGGTKTETIAATGHSYSNGVCTSCGESNVSENSVKIHFVNNLGWGGVVGHVWKDVSGTTTVLSGYEWPGQIVNRDAQGYFTLEVEYTPVSGESLGFLFHNFNGGQTADVTVSYDTLSTSKEIWVKPDTTADSEGKYPCTVVTSESGVLISPEIDGSVVTFRYENSSASAVYLAGSMNDWSTSANPMTLGSDGVWTLTMTLEPGVHEYKFVVDDEWILDPCNGTTGGYDGNSIVVVPTDNVTENTGNITVVLHFYRESGEYDGWDVWFWGNNTSGSGAFSTDTTNKGMIATFTLDGNANGNLGYTIRKTDWSDKEFYDRFIDLSDVVSGTVHYYVTSGVATGSRVLGEDVIFKGKPSYANYDYDASTAWLKTTLPLASTNASDFTVVDSSGNATDVTVTGVTLNGNGYTVTMSRRLTLSELNNYQIRYSGTGATIYINTHNLFYSSQFAADYTYNGDDLGATWSKTSTTFKVWAPTANHVSIYLYDIGNYGSGNLLKIVDMTLGEKGVWSATVSGDLNGTYYNYMVSFSGYTVEATDPYADATGANGDRGMVIDFDSTDPDGWDNDVSPNRYMSYTDAIIYEMHVREMTIDSSSGVRDDWKGKYLGLTQSGTNYNGYATGLDHLKELGVTHVQLMPVYDFNSADEYHLTDWEQYAWGYDPRNYSVPEGSYSTDPFNGEVRVKEFKEMVQTFHENGINVIMDVVYNHYFDGGNFCGNKIVPNYYSRFYGEGNWSNGSGCGNDAATERTMVRNMIVDSIMQWVEEYHIDGFRFDLVGLIDTVTINEIVNTVHAKYPYVMFYGEGWAPGSTAVEYGYNLATQGNAWEVGGFGFFNDTFRNAIAGDNGNSWGFATGSWDYADTIANAFRASNGWSTTPTQTINYVSCHDNYCLMDKIIISRNGAYWEEMVRMNNLSAALYMMAQGTPFIYSGEELLREKKDGDGNRYDNAYGTNDYINKIRWSDLQDKTYAQMTDDYFGGLVDFRKNHAALRCNNGSDAWNYVTYHKISDQTIMFYVSGYPNYECSDGIVIIYNASSSTQWVNLGDYGIPSGYWQACVHGTQAGITPLWGVDVNGSGTGSVGVESISTTILVLGDLVHEESVYNQNLALVNCAHSSHTTSGLCTTCGASVDHSYSSGACSVCGLSESAPSTMTVYYDNSTTNWSGVNVYSWAEAGGKTVEFSGSWPGSAMTLMSDNIYAIELPTAATTLIFNDGSGNQSSNLTVPAYDSGTTLYDPSTGTWITYEESCDHTSHSTAGVCSNCGLTVEHSYVSGICSVCGVECDHTWNSGTCYSCGYVCDHSNHDTNGDCPKCGQWTDHTYDTTGFCTVCGKECWHSWNGNVCTTCGFTCPHTNGHTTSGMCTYCGSDVSHSYVSGACSVCGLSESAPDTVTIYFDNTDTAWSTVYVYAWAEAAGRTVLYTDAWPGTAMTLVSDNIYTITLSRNASILIFNDGSGNQTGNLSAPAYDSVLNQYNPTDGTWSEYGAETECTHSYESVVTAPTCTASGSTVYTCTLCGDSYSEGIAATGHSYESVVTAPTCTTEGYTTHTCVNCGDSYTDSTVAAADHSYTGTVTTAATCTTTGVKTYTCSGCGNSYTEDIAATGHSYESVVTAPTCTAEGYTTYTCASCGDSYTGNTTAATGHVYVDGTCTGCGAVDTSECSHEYEAAVNDATCDTAATTTYTCTLCGHSYTQAADETSTWTTSVPEGVSESEVETATQYSYSTYETTTSTATSMEGYEQVSSDWQSTGTNTIYYVQSWPSGFDTSNSLYTQYNNVSSKVTAYENTDGKLVVDSDALVGYIYYHWCYEGYPYTVSAQTSTYNRFHAYFSTTTLDEADKHDSSDDSYRFDDSTACVDSVWYFYVPVYAQTYTTYEPVYTYGRWSESSAWSTEKVEASDNVKVSTRTVYRYNNTNLAEHVYTSVVTAPTCTTDGYTTHTCTTCNDSYTDSVVAATGHSYTGTITTAAGCTTTGVKTYTCANCGHSYTESIAAAGHSYNSVVTAPTCTVDGYTTHTCSVCGDNYTDSTVAASGHSYANGVCGTCGAADPDYTEPVVVPTMSLTGATLNFEAEIMYNIYFTATDISDVVEMGLITFDTKLTDGTIDNAVTVVPGYYQSGSEYVVHTNGIPAKNLGDAVYFKAYAKLSDGSYAYSNVSGYHAVLYAQEILANSTSQKMKNLVVAMLDYGAAAQTHFGYKTDSLMNAVLTDDQKASINGYSADMVEGLTGADSSKLGDFTKTGGFTGLSPNVAFEGAFAINFYLTTAYAMDGDLTFYYWRLDDYTAADVLTADNASGVVAATATSNGEYLAVVEGIAAKEIDQTVYISAVYESNGVRYCTGVIAYSLATYCQEMISAGTATMQAFAAETVVYGYYAKQYFA